ncbi:MAG: NADH-quinone oxidoreductase subunit C [Gracilibacteraceae bacterium]|jgi:hypothetical protein|nr:NADH-quinone oxidoreductase subunit C [Gracilibacteraceae bacterium]
MAEAQVFFPAEKRELIEIAQRNKAMAYRFCQMHCVKTAAEMFIIYTFEKQDLSIEQYRLPIATDEAAPSISGVFLPAALYENEIAELYGVNFTGMAIDFGGTLYETAKPRAFAEAAPGKKGPAPKAAAAAKKPAAEGQPLDLKKPAEADKPAVAAEVDKPAAEAEVDKPAVAAEADKPAAEAEVDKPAPEEREREEEN